MQNLWSDFNQMAGTTGIIIAILGILGLMTIIYKILSFMYLGVISVPFITNKTTVIFEDFKAIKDKDSRVIYCEAYISQLEIGFNWLNTLVTITPLLGLLGTVIGMIEAFQSMASMGDAVNIASLASGIWKALITTASGLSVAIPLVVLLNVLQSIIDRHTEVLNKSVFCGKSVND